MSITELERKDSPMSCVCGKWRGLKFKDVICDKCHQIVKIRKNMSITKETFQRLVHEALLEIKEEKKDPRERLKESLRPMVEQVLSEIANIKTKGLDDDEDEVKRVSKGFRKDPLYYKNGSPERLNITNLEKKSEIRKIVDDINKEWDVYWDDHNELIINAQNLLKVRITPKFENNFDIDAMVKLVDRIRAIALTWEQVKEFVKVNFKEIGKAPDGDKTKADKAWEKSMANKVDQDENSKDAGPRFDVIKNRGQKINGEDAKIKDTKNKNKDYNEPAVEREEDMPDQPMADVGKLKNLNHDIEKTSQVKSPKHKNDNTLKTSLPKTKKFIRRKSS